MWDHHSGCVERGLHSVPAVATEVTLTPHGKRNGAKRQVGGGGLPELLSKPNKDTCDGANSYESQLRSSPCVF